MRVLAVGSDLDATVSALERVEARPSAAGYCWSRPMFRVSLNLS